MAVENNAKSGRVRKALSFCALTLLFVLVAPLIPYLLDAQAVDAAPDNAVSVAALEHPAIDLWNNVRQRNGDIKGTTQVKGVDSGVLISKTGEDWRRFRMESLVPYGAFLMAGIFGAIVLFHLFRGKTRLPGGRTNKLIPRFTLNQRIVHWFTAGLFWLLAVTGLILLYGRFVLIPLLGDAGFSVTAAASKEIHNLFGPLFVVAVLAMFIHFIKGNFFKLADLKWFAKGGGMFGGHVSAGRYNGGEKTWFWLAMIFGAGLCVSGLILDFAIFGQGREIMALSHVVHGISALILISVSFGHIYLGTAGVEGTIDGMATGSVDAAWAKAHHDQWYQEMTGESVEAAGDDIRSDTVEGGVVRPDTGT